ncbi:PhoH-like phosphate starvation-inducible [Vibrio phage D51]
MGKGKNREKFESGHHDMQMMQAPVINQVEREKLKGRSAEQQKFINLIYESKIVVVSGPQGTGKTFPASVVAWDMFTNPNYAEQVTSITMIRPNEPLGSTMGFMKGDLYEKYKHWLAPIEEGILWRMEDGKQDLGSLIKAKNTYKDLINCEAITPTPVEHLRGRTWNKTFVIIDEAQNLSIEAMKCIMGRIGEDCKVVICGDVDQCDLPRPELSGLRYLRDCYEYALERDMGRVPLRWVSLTETVRSYECDYFTRLFNEVDERNTGDQIIPTAMDFRDNVVNK